MSIENNNNNWENWPGWSSWDQDETQETTSLKPTQVSSGANESSKKTQQSWENFLDDTDSLRGGILSETSYAKVADTPKKIKQYHHKNGIFGSYCLEDPLRIAGYMQNKGMLSDLSLDCFNYETGSELKNNKLLGSIYKTNEIALNALNMQSNGQFRTKIWYENQKNNLMTSEHNDTWHKFNRHFEKNMIFFNPYMNDGDTTKELLKHFFKYANSNLGDDGVVTIMWNPKRNDDLAKVKVTKIADECGFKLVDLRSGKDFANHTGFTHLKNSTSMKLAEKVNGTAKICKKNSDTLLLFKKKNAKNSISSDNKIATAFRQLKPADDKIRKIFSREISNPHASTSSCKPTSARTPTEFRRPTSTRTPTGYRSRNVSHKGKTYRW